MGLDNWIKSVLDKLDPAVKHGLDGGAATVSVGSFLFVEHVNYIVLVLTAIWTLVRIWETETVRKLTGRYKEDNDG